MVGLNCRLQVSAAVQVRVRLGYDGVMKTCFSLCFNCTQKYYLNPKLHQPALTCKLQFRPPKIGYVNYIYIAYIVYFVVQLLLSFI